MSCFAIAHGGAGSAWEWHRVVPLLEAAGHDAVVIDLPCEDDDALFGDYADALAEAVGDRRDVIALGHSLGGFTAPLLADRTDLRGLVFVSAMIPRPGEIPGEWWSNTEHEVVDPTDDEREQFLNGLSPALADAAMEHSRGQSGAPMSEPWPGPIPDVPTHVIAFADDRFFGADWQRQLARERLGAEVELVPGGHCGYLSHPEQLVAALTRFAASLSADAQA